MDTFKISEPEIITENQIDLTTTFNEFNEFLAECGYKSLSIDQISENNYSIDLSDGTKSPTMRIEMIVGKKYVRIMNKRLNPTVTSQLTYNKDLKFGKYKTNIEALVNSVREFQEQNDRLVDIIDELLKVETHDDFEYYGEKYGVDEITPFVKTQQVELTKKMSHDNLIVRLSNTSNKFSFSVIYPEKEGFGVLDNFLLEDNFEPKMNGINNRIMEYNKIAGEIIQRVINNNNQKIRK